MHCFPVLLNNLRLGWGQGEEGRAGCLISLVLKLHIAPKVIRHLTSLAQIVINTYIPLCLDEKVCGFCTDLFYLEQSVLIVAAQGGTKLLPFEISPVTYLQAMREGPSSRL